MIEIVAVALALGAAAYLFSRAWETRGRLELQDKQEARRLQAAPFVTPYELQELRERVRTLEAKVATVDASPGVSDEAWRAEAAARLERQMRDREERQ